MLHRLTQDPARCEPHPLSVGGIRVPVDAHRRSFPAREHILRPGGQPHTYVILAGMACRYVLLRDGRRQFTALLLPGDVFGLESLLQLRCADNIMALTELLCLPVTSHALSRSGTRQMLWDSLHRQAAIARDWMINVGTRPALQRLAHFFCESLARLQPASTAHGIPCKLPLTQIELADLTAMTPVHVSRSLGQLRRMGLASFRNGWLEVPDVERLRRLAGFPSRHPGSPAQTESNPDRPWSGEGSGGDAFRAISRG
jgi:CRP-like cAMP-binding protein